MSKFKDILKELRLKDNLTQQELASGLGISFSSVSMYERGQREPNFETLELIADYFNVDMDYLLGKSSIKNRSSLHTVGVKAPSSITYPIIGEVAAGFGSEAIEEETGDYEQIPVEWLRGRRQDEFFVLRVKGDSMYPNYMDGDRVLVLRTPTVESGTIAVVLYDGQSATLKKVNYMQGEDWMELEPLNREYAPKRIEAADLEQCRVLGEVKRLIRVVSE